MPIGSSTGEYFEDEFERASARSTRPQITVRPYEVPLPRPDPRDNVPLPTPGPRGSVNEEQRNAVQLLEESAARGYDDSPTPGEDFSRRYYEEDKPHIGNMKRIEGIMENEITNPNLPPFDESQPYGATEQRAGLPMDISAQRRQRPHVAMPSKPMNYFLRQEMLAGGGIQQRTPTQRAPARRALPQAERTRPTRAALPKEAIPKEDRRGYAQPKVGTYSKHMSSTQKALLDVIASAEAPNYNVIYSGLTFSDYSKHPGRPVKIKSGPNKGKYSSAAGRYQFIQGTWNNQVRKLGLPDFSPESQDIAAWDLAVTAYQRAHPGRDLVADAQDPKKHNQIAKALRREWTSLPGGIEQGQSMSKFTKQLINNLEHYRNLAKEGPVLEAGEIPTDFSASKKQRPKVEDLDDEIIQVIVSDPILYETFEDHPSIKNLTKWEEDKAADNLSESVPIIGDEPETVWQALTGADNKKRYQLLPEKIVRETASKLLEGSRKLTDALKGDTPMSREDMIDFSTEIAQLITGGGLTTAGGRAGLGMSGGLAKGEIKTFPKTLKEVDAKRLEGAKEMSPETLAKITEEVLAKDPHYQRVLENLANIDKIYNSKSLFEKAQQKYTINEMEEAHKITKRIAGEIEEAIKLEVKAKYSEGATPIDFPKLKEWLVRQEKAEK